MPIDRDCVDGIVEESPNSPYGSMGKSFDCRGSDE